MGIFIMSWLAAGCIITKTRPSTLVRGVEDGCIAVGKSVASKTRKAKAAVATEYAARSIDKLQRSVEAQYEGIAAMSVAERRALEKQQRAVFARAEELRAKREAKSAKRQAKRRPFAAAYDASTPEQQENINRRASRSGSTAPV